MLYYYFGIGLMIALFYDLMNHYLIKSEELRFTNMERLAVILLWPYVLLVTLYKAFFGNRKDE